MKHKLIFFAAFIFLSFNSNDKATKYASLITEASMKKHLSILASDEFGGRATGTEGGMKAAHYIKEQFVANNLAHIVNGSYFQEVPLVRYKNNKMALNIGEKHNSDNDSQTFSSPNVLGYIEGEDPILKNEIIVLSAHYDHLPKRKKGEDKIYNGADDDGSGTTAIIEIARVFSKAKKDGHGSKRSLLFLAVTGEEKGLLGSRWYTDHNPIFPLENTVTNLNIDMIGRVDKNHEGNMNYVYVIGSEKLSSELKMVSESVNNKYTHLELDYTFDDPNDPNRFYYRSDHYNFAKNNIPIIFYFNGVHEDYHQVSDEIDKINFPLLVQRTKLIFYTTWELANRKHRVKIDK